MDPYEEEIVRDIERTLRNVRSRLEGRTAEEQEFIIHGERKMLINIIFIILCFLRLIPGLGGFIAWCASLLVGFFGFDPLKWFYFEEFDHNTKFANQASSDPDLWSALRKAGELFEKRNSPYLNRKSTHIRANVTSAQAAEELATFIINFCKALPVLQGENLPIIVNANDVKIMLASIIKLILNSANSKQRIKENYANPIAKPGAYGWVKYTFSSDYDIESSCCIEKKFVELDIEVLSYCFPNEASFRKALRETE